MFDQYVGKLLEEVESTLKTQHPKYRVIVEGTTTLMTDNYVPDRVTVYISQDGRVTSVNVG